VASRGPRFPIERTYRERKTPPSGWTYAVSATSGGNRYRGILLGYVDERDLTSDYQILFYPWHRIRRIHLLTE
jgi:hypothetical protein